MRRFYIRRYRGLSCGTAEPLEPQADQLKIGDRVRVVGLPAGLIDGELKTRTIFRLCLGKVFPVRGFQKRWVELWVGKVVGKRPRTEQIWIEPEYVETVSSSGKR